MSKIFISALEDNMRTGKLQELISNSLALTTVTQALGYSSNGRYTKLLREFCTLAGIDISHFTVNGKPSMKLLEKQCPQCNKLFTCKSYEEKETCSHACANKYFAYKQGAKNKVHGNTSYAKALEDYYNINGLTIKCCVCPETDVLDVHHVDESRDNNAIDNLVFLCPTHHAKYHRLSDDTVVQSIVDELDRR